MQVAIFIAMQERNVYNRRCQPPESKHINDFKPQRGVTKLGSYAPLGLKVVDVLAFRRLTPPVIDISLFQSVKTATFMLHSLLFP